MTYLDAAKGLDALYDSKLKIDSQLTHYMFLAQLASAVSKKDNTVTLESASNLRALASKVQQWMRNQQSDLSDSDIAQLTRFISLLTNLYDCFTITLQAGSPVEDVFNQSTDVQSFDEMLQILRSFKESSVVEEHPLEILGRDQNMGNLFAYSEYIEGNLHVYPEHPLVNKFETVFNGFFIASSQQDLMNLIGSAAAYSEQYGTARGDQVSYEFGRQLVVLAGKIYTTFSPNECVIIFESLGMFDKSKLPFKYTKPRSKPQDGVIKGSYTDKLTKRVTVFVV